MLQSLILIDALSSAFWEKKKKKKDRNARVLFSKGQTCLAGCAMWCFHGCYVQLMADLKVSI
jgi:hypothetical protein